MVIINKTVINNKAINILTNIITNNNNSNIKKIYNNIIITIDINIIAKKNINIKI